MDALMLTCGTGGGHNTACAAVAEAMAARGHAVTTLNPYTLKNDQVAEGIDKAYILLTQKAPVAFGAGHIQRVVGILLDRYGPSADIVVVCGSNQELKAHVEASFGGRCTVLGFTDQMADYMKACDLYLSKPGGLSSTEAAVVGTALIHITPIPGCETSNMHFFAQNGMSLAVNSPEEELIDACERLLEEGAREKMIECQHRVIPADAATAICELLEEEYMNRARSPADSRVWDRY